MKKIKADSLPWVEITKQEDPYDDTPSIERVSVKMNSNDMDLDNEGFSKVWNESFAKVEIVFFNPRRGNPTDDADADSSDLLNVSSAFYDPDGELSVKVLEKSEAQNDAMETAPLAYIESIELLRGYEKGGQLEAGLAMVLRRLGSDWGCDGSEAPLMVATCESATMSIVERLGADSTAVKLPASVINALGLETWIEKGSRFAAEVGHGAEAGVVLPEAARAMVGFGERSGVKLLGSAAFDADFDLSAVDRSEAQLQKRGKELEKLSEPKAVGEKLKSRRKASESVDVVVGAKPKA